ncbi:MAG: PHP domain-containing protein [Eubacteriales bacterium]
MKQELWNYDIYPKVFRENSESEINIKPLGEHAAFYGTSPCHIRIMPMGSGAFYNYRERKNVNDYSVVPEKDGTLRFTHIFGAEGEYSVRLINDDKKTAVKLAVYAVGDDLYGKYAYFGDMHMHSFLSDGKEAPEVVAANYRGYGYDFMAITDHKRYYPSLRAIEKYKNIRLDMKMYPGEEVQTPDTDIHIINFGGDYSINGLVSSSPQNRDGNGAFPRAVPGNENIPDIMSEEEYHDACDAAAARYNIPEGIEKRSFGACVWAFDEIRKAHGLSIFCHPYWISDVYQVPEDFTEYMLSVHPFDAFEVLGGESYYRQNGFQTALYYEMRSRGIDFPVVGNSDTHGSTEANANRLVANTIVFAKENTRDAIVSAVKAGYSVAVDGIPAEKRYVGIFRLIKYACFLMENYFPLHDKLCAEEGLLMRDYCFGDTAAGDKLNEICGSVPMLRKKYFGY